MKSSMTSSLARIAFIGTGLMGTPMARRLLAAGFAVRVWNRTPRKLEALIDAGAESAASPADAAGGADAVFLCLSNSAAIDAVLFAEQGVARSNAAPPLLADFSTIGQRKTIEFARRRSGRRADIEAVQSTHRGQQPRRHCRSSGACAGQRP
jgi:3-hydroxyisobutyrate dehydrogenase